jgi:uncharacterized damage-inducible protein DinB
MLDRERRLFQFNLGLVERLTEDVADDELAKQPLPGMNPPRWLLAHLAIATDYCLQLIGKERALPADWHAAFGPGSKPDADAGPQPTKAELLAALRQGHERLLAAIDSIDESLLAQPHGIQFESLQKAFPTRGDFLAQMMSNHESLHIGQLSAWRRATGRPPLF